MATLQEKSAFLIALGIFYLVWVIVGIVGTTAGLQSGLSPGTIFKYWIWWTTILVGVHLIVVPIFKFTTRKSK